jgi:hypothetical protein
LENALVYLEALITLFNTWNYFPLVVLNCENQYCFMCYYWLIMCSIQLLLWSGCWFWTYRVKKSPYSWEDASYLTQRSLGLHDDRWRSIGDYNFSTMNLL